MNAAREEHVTVRCPSHTAVDHKRIGGPLATNLHNLNPLPRFQIINCTPHRGHAKAANFRKRGITGNDRRRLIHMGYKVMHQGCCTRAFVNQMAPCLMRRPVGLNPCLAGAAGERGVAQFLIQSCALVLHSFAPHSSRVDS